LSKIKVMDELLSNKIAAGEVVEKCVSIVKELVENAIDAKSNEIKIELKEAGLREIKVTDNGIGMDENDAVMAFQRHATSKLYTDDDLFNIKSLGFRGEALPSIAAVSDVVLKTCQSDKGILVHIKGGKIVETTFCEARKGTSMCVTNLFYNTPARLKHLSSINAELANIIDYVNKMALSYSKIKFILKNDDKEILNTDGSGNLLKVIRSIYGIDVAKKMIEIKASNEDYEITGYISLPEVNRSSRNYMTTLVNGRVIKNTTLNRVINDSYSNYKEDTRYPITVIMINTDPTLIDVNIHPSKMDIKFSNFEDLKELIKTTIINAIKNKLLIPKINVEKILNTTKYENLSLNLERNVVSEDASCEYKSKLNDLVNFNYDNDSLETLEENENNLVNEDVSYIEEIEESKKLPELYPVGLALGTYIVCQNETGVYLIDQHAAQERVNYEKMSYLLAHPNESTINSLIPFIIELPKNDYLVLKDNFNILDNLKIDYEEFGQNSLRIKAHPTWFPTGREEECMNKIIELILTKEKDFSLAKFNDNLAKMVSCKMSVKGNTNITVDAMESILDDLRKCNNPFNCPHGRPTIIHFTIYELEKMFKRSM